ncbi:KAP family P-loop NTPase fold protein [Sphingomonas aurantiaca]|uniref:KAP family P-loop NTPase fold protein n=1 Tax=Sphingomonas aurantiaca TaxID=185949 RepID=UPI002FE32B78
MDWSALGRRIRSMADGSERPAKLPAHSAEPRPAGGDTDDVASAGPPVPPPPAAPPVHAGISADRPRTRLEEDELGHRPFAETIAAGLASRAGADGMVIAVHGRWGSGKTSAVNMAVDALARLEANLEDDRRTIVAYFNPWWFSEQRDLTRAFFSELNASIGRKLSTGVRDGLRRMAKRTSGATELMSAVLQWTPAAPFSKPIADAIKAAGEGADDERSLEAIRDDLAGALEREGRNIVVVVDDVDRLLAEEARQIFRLVKSVADLPRVTYLLVFDRDVAARALAEPAGADGPEWLEKIVQASFDLPPVAQVDLNRLFVARLGTIVGDEPVENVIRWGNLLHGAIAPWLRTPRDVTRLANAIALAWPSVRGRWTSETSWRWRRCASSSLPSMPSFAPTRKT